MSVTANDRRYGPISITGAGQALSVDFRIQNDADALVILYDSSATTYLYTGSGLTLNTHYTISSKTDSGFTMTFASTIGASGDTAWVLDKRDPKTYVSFTAADPLPPETLQKLAIDTLTEDIQSLKEIVGRCLQVVPQSAKKSTKDRTSVDLDIPDLPTTHTVAQNLTYTTDNEWAFGTQADLTGTTVSSFMETVLDDTTAAAARTTLGLVIGTNVADEAETIHRDGSVPFTGDQSMGSNKLTDVTDPTSAQDAATKNYVDTNSGIASVQVFTASGTWTRPAGVTRVLVEVIGGGGGAASGNNVNYGTGGAGGGGGGYARKLLDVSAIVSSTITVGAGGNGGTAPSDGFNGSDSVWSDGTNTITGSGGSKGIYETKRGGAGGGASGGDINLDGSGGGAGTAGATAGHGGSSALGGGARARYYVGNADGVSASANTGGGGSGGIGTGKGGAGGSGIVIVTEF